MNGTSRQRRIAHGSGVALSGLWFACVLWPVEGIAQTALQEPPSFLLYEPRPPRPPEREATLPVRRAEEDLPALDLAQAYRRMLLNNPKIHAARAVRDVGLDARNMARGALLPQVSVNYLRNRTQKTEYVVQRSGVPWIPVRSYTDEDRYYGQRGGLSVEQILFDYSAISAYRMGESQAEYAEAQFRLQFQQQAIALIDGYLNAVLAKGLLALGRQQLRVYEDILHDNERMYAQGEGSQIEILETRAQLSALRAQTVVHENDLADRLGELSMLVGERVLASQLTTINSNGRQPLLQDMDQSALLDSALQQNPEVQAARLAERYNDLAIEREKGRFMPRVSLYAAHERIDSDSVNNRGRDYRTNTVGLQVSIPIFNGGSSYYATRQAYSQRVQASHELQDRSKSAANLVRKYYLLCLSGAQRIRILHESVEDGTSLVVALGRSVNGGERIKADVLTAEHRLYQARQELLRAIVERLQAYSKLRFHAGKFSEHDVRMLSQQLAM